MNQKMQNILTEMRAYIKAQAPDIAAFCGEALNQDFEFVELPNTQHAIVERLQGCIPLACDATKDLAKAVADAAPYMSWRQSYTDDDGFNDHYLANYSWFNLIAPSGPFVCDTLRISVGYWEKGLFYPRHWHVPEEIYLVLAGEAKFISEGRSDVLGGAGTTIAHVSNQPHAAEMTGPLLAMAFWRGDGLEGKSKFKGT